MVHLSIGHLVLSSVSRVSLLLFILSQSWAQTAQAQSCVVGELLEKGQRRFAIIDTRDGLSRAWVEVTRVIGPYKWSTVLRFRDLKTNRTRILFRTEPSAGTHDEYCPLDWSMDSRFLLIEQITGPSHSDNIDLLGWIFDRYTGRRSRIDTRELESAIEAHRIKKQIPSGLFYLPPKGWESTKNHRVVFAPLPSPGEEADLGIWSVEMNGKNPRLLSAHASAYEPQRFGKVIDISETSR